MARQGPIRNRSNFQLTNVTIGSEYDEEEFEFIKACEKYRSDNHFKFLTACEILRVAKLLGYRKVE